MNLPNRLTILRIVLIPFFVACLFISAIPHNFLFALALFGAASITDALDGQIARRRGLVSDFGKFLDPLADKVLVTSALVCFVQLGLAHSVAVLIIIARDLLVTSMRLVAAGSGNVLAAGLSGKIKTAGQMVAITGCMALKEIQFLGLWPEKFVSVMFVCEILIWIIAALTLISGIDYIIKYKSYIKTK